MLTIDQLNDPQIIRAQQAICAAHFVSAYNALIQELNDSGSYFFGDADL